MKSKVALVKCKNYDSLKVCAAVKKAVDLIGGVSSVVKRGDRVLIKPNLLSARPPESGVDTHPEVVRAVIRLVKEAGGIPRLGDSPGGAVKMAEIYEVSGMTRVCREEDVELVNFDRARIIKGIPVARAPLEADVLISVPKFKTHELMMLTAAVKNIFGVIPGLFKGECHKMAPNPAIFARLLVDIFSYAKPHLSIIDGIVAMEGEGPGAGTLRNTSLIAASTDAVSLDAVLTCIMGLKPYEIATTKEADRRGLGIGRMKNIEVTGDKLEEFIGSPFTLPKTRMLYHLPNLLLRLLSGFYRLRPQIIAEKCKECELCVKSCPVGAISKENGKLKFDYRKCILCLCCHEFCPENAILIKKNAFARMIR